MIQVDWIVSFFILTIFTLWIRHPKAEIFLVVFMYRFFFFLPFFDTVGTFSCLSISWCLFVHHKCFLNVWFLILTRKNFQNFFEQKKSFYVQNFLYLYLTKSILIFCFKNVESPSVGRWNQIYVIFLILKHSFTVM